MRSSGIIVNVKGIEIEFKVVRCFDFEHSIFDTTAHRTIKHNSTLNCIVHRVFVLLPLVQFNSS